MPLTDSEPVKLWRDLFKLNLSASWKSDVDKTITDIDLWRDILAHWYYIKNGKKIRKSPAIKPLLDFYESREREQLEARNQRNNQASVVSTRSGERISERGRGDLSQVSVQPPSDYFNAGRMVR